MEISNYLKLLDTLAVEVENELERKVHDTHDFSSSSYNGFDDGHNSGVYTGVELFTEKLRGAVVNASDSDELDRIDILRYRLQGEEVVGISGDGGFGGTVIEFSNGDQLQLLHFSHKESTGTDGEV
jgi:hypothetical protein